MVQLLRKLEEKDVLTRRDVDNLLCAAMLGQADDEGVPHSGHNDDAQKLIVAIMGELQVS